jgi:hypothetical protein
MALDFFCQRQKQRRVDLELSLITKTHQFFASANKLLGVHFMTKLWVKCDRTLYRWGADPDHCEEITRNPIDLLRITFHKLQELGRDDVVESALRLLCHGLGYSVRRDNIFSDKGNIILELLDVNAVLGKLSSCVQDVVSDGVITDSEKIKIESHIAALVTQALEMKHAHHNESIESIINNAVIKEAENILNNKNRRTV